MSVVYVLVLEDYDIGTIIHGVYQTKEEAKRVKRDKEFSGVERGSFFDVEEYELCN